MVTSPFLRALVSSCFILSACAEPSTRSSAVPLASAVAPSASSAAPSDAITAPTLTPVTPEPDAPDAPDAAAFAPPPMSIDLGRARNPHATKPPHPKPIPDDGPYYAALETEIAGDLQGARESYLAIVRATPPSKRLGEAYFGLGEIYLAEAAKDPAKLDLALTAFDKAIATLPKTNALARFAVERQAWTVAAIRSSRARRAGP